MTIIGALRYPRNTILAIPQVIGDIKLHCPSHDDLVITLQENYNNLAESCQSRGLAIMCEYVTSLPHLKTIQSLIIINSRSLDIVLHETNTYLLNLKVIKSNI